MDIEVYRKENNESVIIIHVCNEDASFQTFIYVNDEQALKLSADLYQALHAKKEGGI